MEEIKKSVTKASKSVFDKVFATKKSPSFRVRARRSDKEFLLCSKEVELEIAELVDKLHNSEKRLKVDLEHADITIFCEVRKIGRAHV